MSVTSRCSIETDGAIDLAFDTGSFFRPCSPTLCYKEIQVSTKQRYFSSASEVTTLRRYTNLFIIIINIIIIIITFLWLFSELRTEKFATAYRSSKRAVSLDRQRRTLRA